MPIYRLYLLSRSHGGVEGFEQISSADDVGAICEVEARDFPRPAELWDGSRKVLYFAASQPTRARPSPHDAAFLQPEPAGASQ